MNGFINVLKAPGITSSTVVSVIRHILKQKKVGHAGTLDPSACGVLPIMLGKATKLFDFLDNDGKTYISEFTFGVETDSIDMQGKVTKTDSCIISEMDIKLIIPFFIGKIKQTPPRVSAISINGQKAYSMQRQGIDFSIPERDVEIKELKLIRQSDKNKFIFSVSCSKGTYIRSLCRDMAKSLGTVGFISYLNRTKSDCFEIAKAYSLEELRTVDINNIIIPIDTPISHFQRFDVDDKSKYKLSNGLKIESSIECDKIFRLYNNNEFFALAKNIMYDGNRMIETIKVFVD